MNVIVSNIPNLQNKFSKFTVYSCTADLLNDFKAKNGGEFTEGCMVAVDYFVFNSSTESVFEVLIGLPRLKDGGVKRFFYVGDNKDTQIAATIKGLASDDTEIISDTTGADFCLDNDDELLDYITNVIETATKHLPSVIENNLNVLLQYMDDIKRGDNAVNTKFYQDRVKRALATVEAESSHLMTVNSKVTKATVMTIAQATEIITDIELRNKEIATKLENLQEKVETNNINNSASSSRFSNSIRTYSPYNYNSVAVTVVCIKEVNPCAYLTTFILGYYYHLVNHLHKRAKLIFLYHATAEQPDRYEAITDSIISQTSVGYDTLFDGDIISLSVPLSVHIKRCIDNNKDVIIFVDRMYEGQPLVQGKVKTVWAAGSTVNLDTSGADERKWITSNKDNSDDYFINIPRLAGLSSEAEKKKLTVLNAFSGTLNEYVPNLFGLLDDYIGV